MYILQIILEALLKSYKLIFPDVDQLWNEISVTQNWWNHSLHWSSYTDRKDIV